MPRLEQLPAFVRICGWWERFANWAWPSERIPHSAYSLVHIRFTRYRGSPVSLPDSTEIRRGDLIGEFHFDNAVLMDVVAESMWPLVRVSRAELRALAAWSLQPDFPAELKAFHGMSLLGRGTSIVGLTIYRRPSTWSTRLERLYMQGILARYAREGPARLDRGRTYAMVPDEVWLSRKELLRQYGE